MSIENEELKRVEAMLGSLVPRGAGLDRDRLMFLAGQAAALRGRRAASRWLWPAATAAASLAAMAMAAVAWQQPPVRVVQQVVHLPSAVPQAQSLPSEAVADKALPQDAAPQYAAALGQVASPAVARRIMLARSNVRASGTESYIGLRDQVLALGLESLPQRGYASDSAAGPSANYRNMLLDFQHGDAGQEPRETEPPQRPETKDRSEGAEA